MQMRCLWKSIPFSFSMRQILWNYIEILTCKSIYTTIIRMTYSMEKILHPIWKINLYLQTCKNSFKSKRFGWISKGRYRVLLWRLSIHFTHQESWNDLSLSPSPSLSLSLSLSLSVVPYASKHFLIIHFIFVRLILHRRLVPLYKPLAECLILDNMDLSIVYACS